MNNDLTLVRARHVESVASAAKQCARYNALDVKNAALTDLGVLTGVTLSTTQPTVNGALWYSVDGEPVLKLYHGGHNYTLV